MSLTPSPMPPATPDPEDVERLRAAAGRYVSAFVEMEELRKRAAAAVSCFCDLESELTQFAWDASHCGVIVPPDCGEGRVAVPYGRFVLVFDFPGDDNPAVSILERFDGLDLLEQQIQANSGGSKN